MSSTYTLWCLIDGDKTTFKVIVPIDSDIADLKNSIKQACSPKLENFAAADLILWKLKIPQLIKPAKELAIRIQLLGSDYSQFAIELEEPFDEVLTVFPNKPPKDCLHIFVELPTHVVNLDAEGMLGALLPSFAATHHASVLKAQKAPAPSSVAGNVNKYKSEQQHRPIYNGRPDERLGPPIVIYNESLAQLKHDLSDLSRVVDPPANYIDATAKLFRAATPIYASEHERGEAMYRHLNPLLGVKLQQYVQVLEENSNRRSAEGDALVQETIQDEIFGERKAVVVYIEFKNELGISGDGGLQAALSLRKHIAQKGYDEIRNASCSPCIIISIAGPYIQISGAVFVEVFTVQKFTDYIYLGGDPYAAKQINYIAKVFYAVAQAVRTLRSYYHFLRLRDRFEDSMPSPAFLPNSPLVRFLNFNRRFNLDGRQSSDYHRTIFRAEYDGKPVLVKFCERYSEDAHRLVAAAGLAPTLHFCSLIIGDIFMVVMDLVVGQDAYHEFLHRDLPLTVLNDVKLALEKLHNAGLVYGDVRRPNIMVFKSQEKDEEVWRGLLIDFDWAGPVGKTKYPAMMNDSGQINWANGVAPAAEIKKEHDIEMLGKLNLGGD